MNLLAETHRTSSGRWVLMPPKGRALDGGRTSRRLKVRRRRKVLFILMADGALLTGLMGAFPALRPMLYGTAVLLGLLVLYSGLLAGIAAHERAEARLQRLRSLTAGIPPSSSLSAPSKLDSRNGNGHATSNGNGHWTVAVSNGRRMAATAFEDSEEDVHVIVRRAPAARRTAIRSAG